MRLNLSFFFQAEDGIRDDLVTGVQTCALPISMMSSTVQPTRQASGLPPKVEPCWPGEIRSAAGPRARQAPIGMPLPRDRKSTRLNSSHQIISYAVFCLKKKKNKKQ